MSLKKTLTGIVMAGLSALSLAKPMEARAADPWKYFIQGSIAGFSALSFFGNQKGQDDYLRKELSIGVSLDEKADHKIYEPPTSLLINYAHRHASDTGSVWDLGSNFEVKKGGQGFYLGKTGIHLMTGKNHQTENRTAFDLLGGIDAELYQHPNQLDSRRSGNLVVRTRYLTPQSEIYADAGLGSESMVHITSPRSDESVSYGRHLFGVGARFRTPVFPIEIRPELRFTSAHGRFGYSSLDSTLTAVTPIRSSNVSLGLSGRYVKVFRTPAEKFGAFQSPKDEAQFRAGIVITKKR